MGFAACSQSFSTFYGDRLNVMAYIPGEPGSTGTVTLGAHYDSLPSTGAAPGADDNGSGMAALLVIARQLAGVFGAGVRPRRPVYLVGFGAEEIGLVGSRAFANALQNNGAGIDARCKPAGGFGGAGNADHKAITLDMVGWLSTNALWPRPTLLLETYEWALNVAQEVAQASLEYNQATLDLTYNKNPFGSDHMPFLDNGMPAMLCIHGDYSGYVHYHQSTDVVAELNFELMAMITKAAAGGLLRVAELNV